MLLLCYLLLRFRWQCGFGELSYWVVNVRLPAFWRAGLSGTLAAGSFLLSVLEWQGWGFHPHWALFAGG